MLPTALHSLTVEGYRFYRSDGQPFDPCVMTFVPPPSLIQKQRPRVFKINMDNYNADGQSSDDDSLDIWYHKCENSHADLGNVKSFILAHRCNPTWDTLSDQQREAIDEIEKETNKYRNDGIYFRATILEGLGGCGKTRLMAYIMNHAPKDVHVMYLTKQNRRLQDFINNDVPKDELIPPQPIVDMSKFKSKDFHELSRNPGGRYACTVEKLVYNVGGRRPALETNSRNALQWKMNIPDGLFTDPNTRNCESSVVVILDEYTMISPALLHKLLHCISIMFYAPVVLIMGGDVYQLGPINWDVSTDKLYRDEKGSEAPPDAVTRNNTYYVSDVREELKNRFNQQPFEYHMKGSQRCRNDPQLAKMVVYLRNACQKRTSVKAVERRLVAFGRSHGICLFRCEPHSYGCKAGQLVFDNEQDSDKDLDLESRKTGTDDEDDEDRHLGDYDSRDSLNIKTDWNNPPTLDMSPFIHFYTQLYEEMYLQYNRNGCTDDLAMPLYVYEKASKFIRSAFPVFMVKKNDKCNMLSDTFLKTLYNGVFTELVKRHPLSDDDEPKAKRAKTLHTESNDAAAKTVSIKDFMEKICVSICLIAGSPVQQTMMVGVPYRLTDTLKDDSVPLICNGELVLLTMLNFNSDRSINYILVKSLECKTTESEANSFYIIEPGVTQNRLNVNKGQSSRVSLFDNENQSTHYSNACMFPMVPMVCENIYQMQGNTIVSDCFVDLLSTKTDDIYVAVSRFQKTGSIKGIVLSG